MQAHISTTPFGRRSLTLAHVAAQAVAKERSPEKIVHKWQVFRAICTAKARLGVAERALTVLDALLSFHPETALTGESLVVWPSNHQLALRAHGMAPATLRRHLAGLVDAGLIVRRDSPNGKRYARKGRGGELQFAFGFDLAPLVVRAEEFDRLAEEVAAEERALKLVRERVTLCRRDIAKMIAMAIEENVPVRQAGQGAADWLGIHALFRTILDRVPRVPTRVALEPIADELALLAEEIANILENHVKTQILSAKESQNERHKQNSNPNTPIEFEPALKKARVDPDVPHTATLQQAEPQPRMGAYPLGLVLDACPDLQDYARDGIRSWRDFLATAAVVRPMLGISPSAWEEARAVMGETQAAVVLACILQRSDAINSAGGYLRELTRKAEAGEFSLGPMLMALIGSRKREKKRA